MAGRKADPSNPDWESAADYTQRLQSMIRETVELLGDAGANATYELSGRELAATIRERNKASAAAKGVMLVVDEGYAAMTDSHRGSLLCLIASNLVQNAIMATEPGRRVSVSLADSGRAIALTVADEGSGIPEAVQKHLFMPGRSGRAGGSGLGLAISQLLARQIGASLVLVSTGPGGTTFRVTLPHGS
jgi:signal transduction histidine kinase